MIGLDKANKCLFDNLEFFPIYSEVIGPCLSHSQSSCLHPFYEQGFEPRMLLIKEFFCKGKGLGVTTITTKGPKSLSRLSWTRADAPP